MDISKFQVSKSEVNMFHSIDRLLYTILVMNLARDPIQSMHVMAFWLWLEQIGLKNVVRKQLSMSISTISELTNEAITCITWINNGDHFSASSQMDIPMIKRFIGNQLSLQFFYQNRFLATKSLNKILSEVCNIALGDIMHDSIKRNAAQLFACGQSTVPVFKKPGLHIELIPAERTLFTTFSKGYYVDEYMVWDLFTKNYGPCIDFVQMEKVEYGEQPLYAFVVLHKEEMVNVILNGSDKVRFIINGKQVWARKFEPLPPRPLLRRPH